MLSQQIVRNTPYPLIAKNKTSSYYQEHCIPFRTLKLNAKTSPSCHLLLASELSLQPEK